MSVPREGLTDAMDIGCWSLDGKYVATMSDIMIIDWPLPLSTVDDVDMLEHRLTALNTVVGSAQSS